MHTYCYKINVDFEVFENKTSQDELSCMKMHGVRPR
jgi:hypothetical protein